MESLGAGNRHGGLGELWCLWAVGASGAPPSSYRHRSSEAEQGRGLMDAASVHFTTASFSSVHFLSTGIVSWGTYWKFWLAQIWNRSPIFSSILKVSLSLSFLKKKSNPPPLLISITWISYHNIINSETKSFHLPSSSPTLSFTLCSSQRQKKRRKSTTGASVLPINLPLPYWNVCRISIRAELQLSNIKRWSSAAV